MKNNKRNLDKEQGHLKKNKNYSSHKIAKQNRITGRERK